MIEGLGALKERFAAKTRQIEQNRAPDNAAASDRFYAGLCHAAIRRGGGIAVPKRVVEPHMAERVTVRARLRKAAHIVVCELQPAWQRPPVTRFKSRLVRDHVVAGRPSPGKDSGPRPPWRPARRG